VPSGPDDPSDLVRESWLDAVTELGGDRATAQTGADDLVARYGETHRRYHTLTHVAAVIRDAALLAGELELSRSELARLTLAAAAHDVVYDARPGDDERASAAWAGTALATAGVTVADVERVEQLVLLTLTHETAATDLAGIALLDADLAVLGGTPEAYAVYCSAVRAEYAAVPDDLWRSGRSEVLSALAGRERLYVSEPAHRRWDAAARRNLRGELASLLE
jgi:predicted metal-dependent HD superfamily phosphohydrolase